MNNHDAITPGLASGTWRGRCEQTTPADYIWLSYSLFFFVEPIIRNNRGYWLRSTLIYVPFVVAYILFVQARRIRSQLLLLAAMSGLGLLGFSFNGGASSLVTLATAFLPFVIEDVTTILICFSGAFAALAAVGLLVHESWINIGIAFFLIAVVGSSNIFIGQRKRANARLSLAGEEIERLAALAERERIARDMHDVLGHTLSVIVLKSELAGRLLRREAERGGKADHDRAAAAAEIADVEQTARKALAEVREAIGGYRARGLPAEIDVARRTLATAGVALSCDLPQPLHLTATEETVLSLAVREAVTNIVRHARATRCTLRLNTTTADGQSLLVEDDGVSASVLREGNGLRGMRERVEALGGRLSVVSAASGTRLHIQLPEALTSPSRMPLIPVDVLAPVLASASEPKDRQEPALSHADRLRFSSAVVAAFPANQPEPLAR